MLRVHTNARPTAQTLSAARDPLILSASYPTRVLNSFQLIDSRNYALISN